MDKNFKPLYTPTEAKALTESLIDQDTKFHRELEALINTEEAKAILADAYENGDESAKASIAASTEEQFLDKYAPDGSPKEKGEEADGSDGTAEDPDDDFLEDASGIEDIDSLDDGGSEDDQDTDQDIVDDGGSEDDQDQPQETKSDIPSDNIFAQATSGDDNGDLTDKGGDNAGNPFLEGKKPKNGHELNESRKAARASKSKRASIKKMNESFDADEACEEIDDKYFGKIWKYLKAKGDKFAKQRDKILFYYKIQNNAEYARSISEKMIIKLGIDVSSYGKEAIGLFTRVVQHVAGDLYDMDNGY